MLLPITAREKKATALKICNCALIGFCGVSRARTRKAREIRFVIKRIIPKQSNWNLRTLKPFLTRASLNCKGIQKKSSNIHDMTLRNIDNGIDEASNTSMFL